MVLKIDNIKCWKDTSKWNCHTLLMECKMVQPLCKTVGSLPTDKETDSEVWTCQRAQKLLVVVQVANTDRFKILFILFPVHYAVFLLKIKESNGNVYTINT